MNTEAAYLRNSPGERAEREHTIDSQRAAVRERAKEDGFILSDEDIYVDELVSGAIPIRPAMERLRDRADRGELKRLYVYHPDRFARGYVNQALLLEEFRQAGVQVIFLKGGTPDTPEGALLVQVQGIIAEYERANILDRTQRGRIYRARAGEVSVLMAAPYGYRYVRKVEGGSARYEVVEEAARVVQRVFHEVAVQGRSLGEVARGLTAEGIRSSRGGGWGHVAIWQMLKNPAYMGLAAFGKRKRQATDIPVRRGRRRVSKSGYVSKNERRPPEEWIRIPVPAIVSEELYESAQRQLAENRRFALRNARAGERLVRGLVVCAQCRYAWYASANGQRTADGRLRYVYYRCAGRDPSRFNGKAVCSNRPIRADDLDREVWQSVEEYLRDPARLVEEFRRRQESPTEEVSVWNARRDAAVRAVEKSRRTLGRLVEAYEAGVFTLDEVRDRLEGVRQRIQQNEAHLKQVEQNLAEFREWEEVVTQVSEFAARVEKGLAELDGVERQKLVRLVVDRVEVGPDKVTIVHRVPFARQSPSRGDRPDGEEAAPGPQNARAVG